MSTITVNSSPVIVTVNNQNPVSITVPTVGIVGPVVIYGTGAPPDPTNLPNGTIFFRYTP